MENAETTIWAGNQAKFVPQLLQELDKVAKGRGQLLKI